MDDGAPEIVGRTAPAPQGRLVVGAPDDALEKEADRAADHVIRASAPRPAAPRGGSRAPLSASPDPLAVPTDFPRKPEAGVKSNVLGDSPGTTLPGSVRDSLERGFARPLEHVRIHADAEASRVAQDLGAKAFTHGSHIAFRQGEYQPNTQAGQRLLAHEIAHSVQQGSQSRAIQRTPASEARSEAQELLESTQTGNWVQDNWFSADEGRALGATAASRCRERGAFHLGVALLARVRSEHEAVAIGFMQHMAQSPQALAAMARNPEGAWLLRRFSTLLRGEQDLLTITNDSLRATVQPEAPAPTSIPSATAPTAAPPQPANAPTTPEPRSTAPDSGPGVALPTASVGTQARAARLVARHHNLGLHQQLDWRSLAADLVLEANHRPEVVLQALVLTGRARWVVVQIFVENASANLIWGMARNRRGRVLFDFLLSAAGEGPRAERLQARLLLLADRSDPPAQVVDGDTSAPGLGAEQLDSVPDSAVGAQLANVVARSATYGAAAAELRRRDQQAVALDLLRNLTTRELGTIAALPEGRSLLTEVVVLLAGHPASDLVYGALVQVDGGREFLSAVLGGGGRHLNYQLQRLTAPFQNGTRIEAEPRPNGRVWVRLFLDVRLDERTASSWEDNAFVRGIELSAEQVIRVELADEGGRIVYRPAAYLLELAATQHARIARNAFLVAGFAASFGMGTAAGGLGAGARALVWIEHASNAAAALAAAVAEHRHWITTNGGDAGQAFVNLVNGLDSAFALFGLGQMGVAVGRLLVATSRSWMGLVQRLPRIGARDLERVATLEGPLTRIAAQLAARRGGTDRAIGRLQQLGIEAEALLGAGRQWASSGVRRGAESLADRIRGTSEQLAVPGASGQVPDISPSHLTLPQIVQSRMVRDTADALIDSASSMPPRSRQAYGRAVRWLRTLGDGPGEEVYGEVVGVLLETAGKLTHTQGGRFMRRARRLLEEGDVRRLKPMLLAARRVRGRHLKDFMHDVATIDAWSYLSDEGMGMLARKVAARRRPDRLDLHWMAGLDFSNNGAMFDLLARNGGTQWGHWQTLSRAATRRGNVAAQNQAARTLNGSTRGALGEALFERHIEQLIAPGARIRDRHVSLPVRNRHVQPDALVGLGQNLGQHYAEVKAWNASRWSEVLTAVEQDTVGRGLRMWNGMIDQLEGARQASSGSDVYLVVSDAINEGVGRGASAVPAGSMLPRLQRALDDAHLDDDVTIVFLSDADILANSRRLRLILGLPH